MKHNWNTTILLLSIFVLAQIVGLSFISYSVNTVVVNGQTNIDFDQTTIGERPVSSGFESAILIFFGIGIGTVLLLYLARKNKVFLWKAWFFVASVLAISISL